jgi:hypothetical protein
MEPTMDDCLDLMMDTSWVQRWVAAMVWWWDQQWEPTTVSCCVWHLDLVRDAQMESKTEQSMVQTLELKTVQ